MSTLHYFQRYSTQENWLTNSTLLLLQHFYLYNPIKFQSYLNNFDEQLELNIGPIFLQQTKTTSSVPDGSGIYTINKKCIKWHGIELKHVN